MVIDVKKITFRNIHRHDVMRIQRQSEPKWMKSTASESMKRLCRGGKGNVVKHNWCLLIAPNGCTFNYTNSSDVHKKLALLFWRSESSAFLLITSPMCLIKGSVLAVVAVVRCSSHFRSTMTIKIRNLWVYCWLNFCIIMCILSSSLCSTKSPWKAIHEEEDWGVKTNRNKSRNCFSASSPRWRCKLKLLFTHGGWKILSLITHQIPEYERKRKVFLLVSWLTNFLRYCCSHISFASCSSPSLENVYMQNNHKDTQKEIRVRESRWGGGKSEVGEQKAERNGKSVNVS